MVILRFHVLYLFNIVCLPHSAQLFFESIAKGLVLFKVLGNLRASFRRVPKVAKSYYSLRHMSVCPSLRMHQIGSHRTNFHEI